MVRVAAGGGVQFDLPAGARLAAGQPKDTSWSAAFPDGREVVVAVRELRVRFSCEDQAEPGLEPRPMRTARGLQGCIGSFDVPARSSSFAVLVVARRPHLVAIVASGRDREAAEELAVRVASTVELPQRPTRADARMFGCFSTTSGLHVGTLAGERRADVSRVEVRCIEEHGAFTRRVMAAAMAGNVTSGVYRDHDAEERGTWRLESDVLLVEWEGGETTEYDIDVGTRGVLFDGVYYGRD